MTLSAVSIESSDDGGSCNGSSGSMADDRDCQSVIRMSVEAEQVESAPVQHGEMQLRRELAKTSDANQNLIGGLGGGRASFVPTCHSPRLTWSLLISLALTWILVPHIFVWFQ